MKALKMVDNRIVRDDLRCIGCGICLKACPHGCLVKTEKGISRDRSRCKACGKCTEECPSGAQEMLGREVTVEGLLAELVKDKIYYEKSGGGVTLSGGEPLMQPDFAVNLLRRLKENGVSTAVDTCGVCSPATFQAVLPYTDLVLYDLKGIDPAAHKQHTGLHNEGIIKNILSLRDYMAAHPGAVRLWIRTPLIPGATAGRETIEGVGKFIHDNLNSAVQRWELCAFNNLCRDKYRRLDMEWQYASAPLFSKQELADFERTAKASGPDPASIFVTGVSRIES